MGLLKRYQSFWEFLLLWAIWMVIIFALTDLNQHLDRFATRAFVSFIGFFIVIQINVRYLCSTLLIGGTVLLLNLDILPWSKWFEMAPLTVEEIITRTENENIKWFREVMHLTVALLSSTVLGITRYADRKSQEAFRLQNEKLESELKFLKSQVNPHFLFNALNNIYSLAVMQAPQTPDSVMQLSEILRYMVYDSNETSVTLKNEISYIENFVDLQLLKDSKGMNVSLDLDKNSPELRIAPLLFIPFVENAFKHSKIENSKEGFIKIKLDVKDKVIKFSCINSKPKEVYTKDSVGGVGLTNTTQRLALLYPDDQHQLTINDSDDRFEVNLIISTI